MNDSRRIIGEVRIGGRKVRDIPGSDTPICDFCAEPNPTRTFQADGFTVYPGGGPGHAHFDPGPWAACDPCGSAIDQDSHWGLWVRWLTRRLVSGPPPSEADERLTQKLFAGFLQRRRKEVQ